jgi:hypothetical protein
VGALVVGGAVYSVYGALSALPRIKRDVEDLKEAAAGIKKDAEALLEITEALQDTLDGVARDLEAVREDTVALQADTMALRTDTMALRTDTTVLVGDTASLKADTRLIKTEIASIKRTTESVESSILRVEAAQGENTSRLAQLNCAVETLPTPIEAGIRTVATKLDECVRPLDENLAITVGNVAALHHNTTTTTELAKHRSRMVSENGVHTFTSFESVFDALHHISENLQVTLTPEAGEAIRLGKIVATAGKQVATEGAAAIPKVVMKPLIQNWVDLLTSTPTDVTPEPEPTEVFRTPGQPLPRALSLWLIAANSALSGDTLLESPFSEGDSPVPGAPLRHEVGF